MPKQPQSGLVVWLTGLSGAGKSTLSDLGAESLRSRSIAVIQLDGDALRSGLNKDLGFRPEDRDENIRRASEVAKLVADQGVVALCSFISPMRSHRAMVRAIAGSAFFEVYVDCPLETAIERDPKGLYARALRGEISHFTGVSAPYEEPESPDLRIQTHRLTPEESAALLCTNIEVKISPS